MSGPSEFSRSLPAFPRSIPFEDNDTALGIAMTSGMTLRDYFAAAALPGVMTSQERVWKVRGAPKGMSAAQEMAMAAYMAADAMLAEREKP